MKLSLLHRRLAGERLIGSGLLVDFHHDEMTENGVGIEVRPLDRGGLLAVRSRGGTEQKAERIIFLRGGDRVTLEYPHEQGMGQTVPVDIDVRDLREIVDMSSDRTGGSRLFVNRGCSGFIIEPMDGYHANIGFRKHDEYMAMDARYDLEKMEVTDKFIPTLKTGGTINMEDKEFDHLFTLENRLFPRE